MSSANLNQLLPLPENIPTATRCVRLDLPDDPEYFRMFMGALDTLTNWYSYDRDVSHTGRLVAAVWKKVIKTLQLCPPAIPPPPGGGVILPMFRQNPADLCQLQVSLGNDPITGLPCWCTIYDGSLCVPNPVPGGGVTPPSAGKCQDYKLKFQANTLTPLPFAVNTGDTIQINSLMGAGSDGTPDWYCPDGEYFIAGFCAGGQHLVSGDPLNTSPHMSIVLKIGSTYHPFVSGTLTVPSGVVNLIPYIGVNDASLTDDGGEYTIDINYCNNATPPAGSWCKFLDFTVSPQGFTALVLGDGAGGFNPAASWVSGVGWTAPYKLQNSTPQYQWGFAITRDLGMASDLPWTIELKGHGAGSVGVTGPLTSGVISAPATSALYGTFVNSPTVPTNTAYDFTVNLTGTNQRYLYFLSSDYAIASIPSPLFSLASAKISGVGPNPFGVSDC